MCWNKGKEWYDIAVKLFKGLKCLTVDEVCLAE